MWKKLGFRTPLRPQETVKRAPGDAAAGDWQDFVQIFDFLELIREWPALVGDMLAAQSVPMKLKNKTLFILTRHPIFAEKLNYLQRELIQKIITRFPILGPQIERLAFETNESFFIVRDERKTQKPTPVAPHPFDPNYRRALVEAEKIFADVTDPTEKARWISLYVQTAQGD